LTENLGGDFKIGWESLGGGGTIGFVKTRGGSAQFTDTAVKQYGKSSPGQKSAQDHSKGHNNKNNLRNTHKTARNRTRRCPLAQG